jgi:hypothetical protein
MDGNAMPPSILQLPSSKLVFALGVKEFEGTVMVGFRYENLNGTAQITVVGQGGINKRLPGGDAVLVEHYDEHLGIDDRAGIEQFHAGNLTTNGHG